MPTVYLRKDLYDAIIKSKQEVNQFVNKAVEDALKPMGPAAEDAIKPAKERKGGKL